MNDISDMQNTVKSVCVLRMQAGVARAALFTMGTRLEVGHRVRGKVSYLHDVKEY